MRGACMFAAVCLGVECTWCLRCVCISVCADWHLGSRCICMWDACMSLEYLRVRPGSGRPGGSGEGADTPHQWGHSLPSLPARLLLLRPLLQPSGFLLGGHGQVPWAPCHPRCGGAIEVQSWHRQDTRRPRGPPPGWGPVARVDPAVRTRVEALITLGCGQQPRSPLKRPGGKMATGAASSPWGGDVGHPGPCQPRPGLRGTSFEGGDAIFCRMRLFCFLWKRLDHPACRVGWGVAWRVRIHGSGGP